MFRVSYSECKTIWDNKKYKDLVGQQDYCIYVAKKLGIVRNKHNELKDHYNRYMRELNEYS